MVDNEHLLRVLDEITDTIGYLHNQVKTVLRGTPDQERRQSRITEVALRRPKSYYAFVRDIGKMQEAERHSICFGTYPLLWEEFPPKLDLDENVGNAANPGDGKVYEEKDIQKVTQILKAFYDAWTEVMINVKGVNPMSPETPRRIGRLPNMARVCLILRGMRQERLLDRFCENSKDDKHLPLKLESVKSILDYDALHADTFVTEQYRAVCRAWSDGVHIKIPEEEPLPLKWIYDYGKGSYGSVSKDRDAFTDVFYARKEQISFDARHHLQREIARLKKLCHRHIVQFVKSYQRGNRYGILLKPAATTDLKKLLDRYRRNKIDYSVDSKGGKTDRVVLKPLLMTAFGCLSQGLAHVHDSNIRHKDIKPANILYEKAFSPYPARFLWADFGLAHDFANQANSKTVSKFRHRYSPRYAAPEIMEEVEARNERGESFDDDTDDDALLQSSSSQVKVISHGRSSDIYSFGIVFLEILSYLIAKEKESPIPGDFEACMPFWKNIRGLHAWAQEQIQKLPPDDPLIFLFQISLKMITRKPEDRPNISEVVEALMKASSQYFCSACLHHAAQPTSQAIIAEEQMIEGLESAKVLCEKRLHMDGQDHASEHEIEVAEDSMELQPDPVPPPLARASKYLNGNEPIAKRSSMRSSTHRKERPLSQLRFDSREAIIPPSVDEMRVLIHGSV